MCVCVCVHALHYLKNIENEFKQHSKESRGVLGQAGKQAASKQASKQAGKQKIKQAST